MKVITKITKLVVCTIITIQITNLFSMSASLETIEAHFTNAKIEAQKEKALRVWEIRSLKRINKAKFFRKKGEPRNIIRRIDVVEKNCLQEKQNIIQYFHEKATKRNKIAKKNIHTTHTSYNKFMSCYLCSSAVITGFLAFLLPNLNYRSLFLLSNFD